VLFVPAPRGLQKYHNSPGYCYHSSTAAGAHFPTQLVDMPTLPVLDSATGDQLAWAAFAFNVGLHFTQCPLMLQMLRDNDPASLARYVSVPALLQAFACSLWLGYGLATYPSAPLVANNSIGLALSLLYVGCFVLKKPSARDKAAVAALWALFVSAAALLYGLLYARAPVAGADGVAAGVTIAVTSLFWASPLRALQAAAKDLDESKVPLPLTFIMLATVTLWLAVGCLVGDVALVACSAIGVFFTIAQVALWGCIRLMKQQRAASTKDASPDASAA
jgi:hypothetical protein